MQLPQTLNFWRQNLNSWFYWRHISKSIVWCRIRTQYQIIKVQI